MKALSLRLDDRLSRQFDAACRRLGYKKNTLLTRMITAFVQHKQNLTSAKGKKQTTKPDPFLNVIGIISEHPASKDESFSLSEKEIDQIVYEL